MRPANSFTNSWIQVVQLSINFLDPSPPLQTVACGNLSQMRRGTIATGSASSRISLHGRKVRQTSSRDALSRALSMPLTCGQTRRRPWRWRSHAWPPRSSRSLLAATLTLLSGAFQLTVALGMDFHLSPREHTVWRHIADGAVQPDIVVTVHILLDQATRRP